MLADVDHSLRAWLGASLPDRTDLDFGPPAAIRPGRTPLLGVFLHAVVEDPAGLAAAPSRLRGPDGRVEAVRFPPRLYRLAYLVTAWAADPAAEHRLLGEVLAAAAGLEALPGEHARGALREVGAPIPLRAGAQPPRADLWAALGVPLRSALDLTLTVPVRPALRPETAPPAEAIVLRATQLADPDAESLPAAPTYDGQPLTRRRWKRTTVTED